MGQVQFKLFLSVHFEYFLSLMIIVALLMSSNNGNSAEIQIYISFIDRHSQCSVQLIPSVVTDATMMMSILFLFVLFSVSNLLEPPSVYVVDGDLSSFQGVELSAEIRSMYKNQQKTFTVQMHKRQI